MQQTFYKVTKLKEGDIYEKWKVVPDARRKLQLKDKCI